ncbi:copper resistance protein CopC [Streptomyces sp. NPDC047000]|uniref:copper resistance CopC/CopD family protein n=1 Tax=Streptomyces sp. NPDC047000 TaxID=3155474 RepID=UPI0033E0ED0D
MPQTITPRIRTLVLLLLAVTGMLLAGAGPASAHAALTGSNPQQGVVVAKAPTEVALTFSEKVALADDSLRVLDPRGKRVDVGKPSNPGGTTYAVQVRTGLGDGTYTVTYQVVSADSHPVAGAFTFSVGTPSKTAVSASGPTAGGGIVGWLYGLGRYVSYAGFIVLAGGAAFVLACWPRGAGVKAMQRLVVSGWLALTAATLALLLLRGSYTGSGKAADILDLSLLAQVLQTKTGAALVSRLLLLAAGSLFIAVLFGTYGKREDGEEKRDLAFGLAIGGTVVAAGLAASWALAEHASTGLQPAVAMPVDVVHLLAVAVWLGGLTALLTALYKAPADTPVEAAAVGRFSRLAFGAVLALVATGAYQSWRQLGSWSAFTGTTYGRLLLAKIGLVAVMVALAWFSRRWTERLTEAAVTQKTEQAGKAGKPGKAEGTERAKAAETVETAEKDEARGVKEPAAARNGKGSRTTPTSATSATASASGTRAARAAQLARQRAVVNATRLKRLRDADTDRAGLRRSVLAEAAVAVVVLAVTTVLTQSEPGRTVREAEAAQTAASSSSPAPSTGAALTLDMSFDTGGTDGKGVVRLELDPAGTGANTMDVYVQRPGGSAFDVPEVKVSFTLDAKKIGPLPVAPDHIATGHWAATALQIPMAGDWKIAVTVRTSDIDQTTVSKNAQIG